MEILTLEQLMAPDPKSLRIGWTGRLSPEAALFRLQSLVAETSLPATTPELVQQHFDACCDLFRYGYFRSAFFTLAAGRIYQVFEAALGAKFLEVYRQRGGIPVVRHGGREEVIECPTYFSEIADRTKVRWRGRTGMSLKGHPTFEPGLTGLQRWALEERLLATREGAFDHDARRPLTPDEVRERELQSIAVLRNLPSHAHFPLTVMAEDAAMSIRRVADRINELWRDDGSERSAGESRDGEDSSREARDS